MKDWTGIIALELKLIMDILLLSAPYPMPSKLRLELEVFATLWEGLADEMAAKPSDTKPPRVEPKRMP